MLDDSVEVPNSAEPQRKRRVSGERYRDLFERAPEPYLLTTGSGEIRLANARARELFGASAGEVEGRNLADFIDPSDHGGLQQQLDRAARGQGIQAWEVRLREHAIEPRVLASVQPDPDPDDGANLRWVLWDAMPLELVRDRLTRLLEDSQGDAAALRSLSEWQASLLGSAAQDMRTPLQVISSTLDSLLEGGAQVTTPVARSMLERASRQVMKLRRLLPTLLQLGHLQLEGSTGGREHIQLQELVDQVLQDLEPLERDVTWQFEVDTLHADRLQLARVLIELVNHVIEHGPPDSTLRMGATARGVDVEVFLDVDGYQMSDQVKQVIFSPFLGTGRGGDEANGDDLGLSLVAVFARMHGGRAWVQDAPRGGTSFRVLLSNALPDSHRETDRANSDGQP